MKNSMRKYLIFALVVVAMFTAVFSVSAAEELRRCSGCNGAWVTPSPIAVVDATCEAKGYIDYGCPKCDQYFYSKETDDRLDHILNWEYVKNGDHYEYVAECQRARCNHTKTESVIVDGIVTPVKYYRVEFRNAFATKTKLNSCKYTTIATDYDDVEVAVEYVKEGELVSHSGPHRDADEDFGGYTFLGWASATKITAGATAEYAFDARRANDYVTTPDGIEYTNKELREFLYGVNGENHVYMKTTGVADTTSFKLPIEGETVKADYVVYAIFDVAAIMPYEVTFYDEHGRVIDDVYYQTDKYNMTVKHGDDLSKNNGKKLQKADEDGYYYVFSHWVLKGTETVIDLSAPVYASIDLQARFLAKPKEYTLKYFYRDDNNNEKDDEEIILNGEALFDVITVAPDPSNNNEKKLPVNGLGLLDLSPVDNAAVYDKLYSYSDFQNDYYFTGKWIVAGTNTVFDLKNMNFYGILDTQQTGGYIKLVPQYEAKTRLYMIVVTVEYINDYSTSHSDDVYLTVESEGEFITGKKLDFSDKSKLIKREDGTEYYRVEFYVPYRASYDVIATADAYADRKTTTFFESTYGSLKLVMVRVGREECSCLCHSMIKPIWIKVLNLLNTLFKLKVVCCDDMYATIGGDLNYTPY